MSACVLSMRYFSAVDHGWIPAYLFEKPVNDDVEQQHDVQLLRQIAQQNREAFAEFYDRHAPVMFSLACKILNNATDAEDVLQEIFAQIWERPGQFDSALGKPSTWVATLVRNRALDKIRSSHRRSRLADEVEAEVIATSKVTEANNRPVQGHEETLLIRSLMAELPAEQRNAIELAYFSGLTQHEISERLHEPLGTIKARIRRGLLKLRDGLEGLL